jgi:hypothetical protein
VAAHQWELDSPAAFTPYLPQLRLPASGAFLGPERVNNAIDCMSAIIHNATMVAFHGARGGAPKGRANGAWQHGRFTDDAMTIRRQCTALVRNARKTIAKL